MNRLIDQPKTIFIEITTACNSQCKYCHMWMTEENPDSLTTAEKINILEQFKRINPTGEVVLTGGETMLKYDEFFALTNKCLELGLACAANTNASFINDDNLNKVLAEGPKYLVISLDSHLAQPHDYSRGRVGNFAEVTKKLKKLAAAKKKNNYKTEIITNSVIFDANVGQLKEFILFAEQLKIDGILFQLLSRTFYKKGQVDYFFNEHFFKDKDLAIKQIQGVIEMLESHPIIRTSRQDFQWMKLYIENPDFISEPVCNSYERNIMIDGRGETRLCFNMNKISGLQSLGNIRDHGLEEIWNSAAAAAARKIMQDCRLSCGMLNCHRKK